MNRLILIALASLAFAGCATNPDGTPDCTNAPSQRSAIQAGIVAAQVARDTAYEICKAGEPGDKCRKTADQILLGANAAAQIALITLNARCPI